MPASRAHAATRRGIFVALEGGEGAGKSTQARLLAGWLRGRGHEVLLTFEPGDTELGRTLREALLHLQGPQPSPRAEALLYAADRAEHVTRVVRPALDRGAVVVTDRYLDSSVAYQGSGRDLGAEEIEELSVWAVGGLRPDLTVVVDVDPRIGLARFEVPHDRLESEPLEFHDRVRAAFLALARRDPDRYLVVDGTAGQQEVAERIRARVAGLLGAATDPVAVAESQP